MKKEDLPKLAELIGWKFEGEATERWRGFSFSKNGWGKIILRLPDEYTKQRIIITGYPPPHQSKYRIDFNWPKDITVAENRDTEAVAREIKRRFIPNWIDRVSAFKQHDARQLAHEQRQVEREKHLREICPLLDEKLSFWEHPDGEQRISLDVKAVKDFIRVDESGAYIYADCLEIKANVPQEIGEEILKLLARIAPKAPAQTPKSCK